MKVYLIEIFKWRRGDPSLSSGDINAKIREDVLTHRIKVDEETINTMIRFIRDRLSPREVLQVSEIIVFEEYNLIHRTENI